MRILISGTNYHPELTGVGKYTGDMAAWLMQRGHDVSVVAAMPYYPQWRIHPDYRRRGFFSEVLDGVRVMRTPVLIPGKGTVGARSRLLLEVSYNAGAARWWIPALLSSSMYDVVIAVCPPLQAALWPLLYSQLKRVPWVLHVQDLQLDAALKLGIVKENGVKSALFRIEKAVFKAATRVSTITEAMRERVIGKGVTSPRALLFPNWTDVDFIKPCEPEAAVRKELGAGPSDVLVLYAGNLGKKQGLDLLLAVANKLRGEPHIRFAIVGSGSERGRLERDARVMNLDNVTFRDLYPWEAMPTVLTSADMHLVVQRKVAADLVMPSKLTNILAAGRPSVATAASGTELHTVVAGHETGLVVEPEDEHALANCIRDLAIDPKLRSRLGKNARDYAERYLAKDSILLRFEASLQELVAERRGTESTRLAGGRK